MHSDQTATRQTGQFALHRTEPFLVNPISSVKEKLHPA
jgi:hypothetical protein